MTFEAVCGHCGDPISPGQTRDLAWLRVHGRKVPPPTETARKAGLSCSACIDDVDTCICTEFCGSIVCTAFDI